MTQITLTHKDLRQFGLLLSAAIIAIFGAITPLLLGRHESLWTWLIAAVLLMAALLAPQLLRPVYYVWVSIGKVLKRINTPIILGAVYLVIFMPISLVRKVIGKDAMRRRYNSKVASYREASEHVHRNMENPF